MRQMLLIGLFISLAAGAAAQTAAKIKLQNPGFGKITLTGNKTRVTVNLSKDVAGCAFAAAAVKKAFKDCAAGAAEFQLIDATVKNNQTYLLISSEAMGNCNVCGRCGASEAFALIWLKLDRNLQVLDKKSVPIDFCRLDIELVSDILDFDEETQNETLRLKFADDILAFDFEKTIFADRTENNSYEFSHFEYNRKTPEAGFIIKTEKRERSSVPER
jgi:hypothetical protein